MFYLFKKSEFKTFSLSIYLAGKENMARKQGHDNKNENPLQKSLWAVTSPSPNSLAYVDPVVRV